MKKPSFLRSSPAAYLAVPLVFAVLTLLALTGFAKVYVSPYLSLVSWFFSTNQVVSEPQDLFADATALLQSEDDAPQGTVPLSSITYPANGDRYGRITISGTTVDAPLYYGDSNSVLNQGVGTYKDDARAGIPGEGKTVLLAGHNNTFFNDLQSIIVGDIITIETHYGTYAYTVERCDIYDYRDTTSYDFTRTDENLILYTCYPFDALGFTSDRYFVYASYTSGPVLDAAA